MKRISVALIILLISLLSSNALESVSDLKDYLQETGYQLLDRPSLNGGPVNVSIQLGLYSLRNVDKKSFTFNLAFSCIAAWNDERLSKNKSYEIVGKV